MRSVEEPLNFSKFGYDDGKIVIYFHGAPGSPEECAVFDKCGKENGLTFICFDRFSVDPSISGESYYQVLADEVRTLAGSRKVDIVGFSIGAFISLQTCRYLGGTVRSLHLVSAAAPLEAGDFLKDMAGGAVFKLATHNRRLFVLLSRWQRLVALIFPRALFRLLFCSATSGDRKLAGNPAFRSHIADVLKYCFASNVRGYERDVTRYVQGWAATLSEVLVETHIWHGAEDNWSPKSMAEYLQLALPNSAGLEVLERQSHYSCLHEVAPRICSLLKCVSAKGSH